MELALLSSPSLPPNEEDRFSLIQKLEQDSFEQMIDLNKTKVRENFSQQIQLFDLAKFSLKRQQSLATQDSRKLLIEKTQERAIKNTQLPIKLTWKDLSYTIQVKDTYNGLKGKIPLQILKNCTGYALPGQTLYIMGASGAGKTSLMNAIADRIKLSNGAQLTGEVMLNDRFQLSQQLFGSCCAYVMQDDILFETFTVKEALTFAARLKLNFSKDKQDDRIATLLKQLGLEKCQDTQIGSVYKKTISGGERKRCSIGVELIADPSVILLDEPTSGLDSFMAKQICKLSQQLAHEQGKTVITTIHQPSSEAFSFFDRLLLMSDGNTVY